MRYHIVLSSSLFMFLLACTPKFMHATDIQQSDIPFVITTAGTYNLIEDVTYDGHHGAAITIKADNVVLNFNMFSLTLKHLRAIGIFAKNISDFIISSGAIINKHHKSEKGSGIHITESYKGTIRNIATINSRNGLFIKKSDNITIINSTFYHATKSGVVVKDSQNIDFDNCVFTHCSNGLRFKGSNRDCSVINSEFPNSKLTNLYVERIDGMMVENCSFTNHGGDDTKANLVQFGDADPSQECNDVIIKNCTIINRPPHEPVLGNTAPEGLGIYQGSGFLVESCVIDIDNTNQDPDADLSGIHISNPGLGVNGTVARNVIVRGCDVLGLPTDGIYPDVGSSGILIEDCLVTGALKDGIFLAGTSASTVTNNTVVNNGTNGIFLGEASFSNSIVNNTVNSNGFNPIVASIPPIGTGIGISSDSSLNLVQGNTVFNNATSGINDQGTNNRIFSNTAYSNTTNYVAATDIIVISAPGDATLTAANISA